MLENAFTFSVWAGLTRTHSVFQTLGLHVDPPPRIASRRAIAGGTYGTPAHAISFLARGGSFWSLISSLHEHLEFQQLDLFQQRCLRRSIGGFQTRNPAHARTHNILYPRVTDRYPFPVSKKLTTPPPETVLLRPSLSGVFSIREDVINQGRSGSIWVVG